MEQSSAGRIVSVLTSPTKTFQAIAERPTWVLILVFMLIIGGVTSWLVLDKIDPDAQRQAVIEQLEERQGMAPTEAAEMADQQVEIMERFGFVFVIVGVAFSVIAYLLVAALMLAGGRFLGGSIGFVAALSMSLHAFMPQVVKALLSVPIILSRESISPEAAQGGNLLMSNLSFLAGDDTSPVLAALYGSLDLFTLWTVILLTLGLSTVAKISKGAAAAWCFGLWGVWLAIRLGLAAVFGG